MFEVKFVCICEEGKCWRIKKKLELACNYLSTVLSMGKTYYTKVEQQVIFGGYLKSLNQLNSGEEMEK